MMFGLRMCFLSRACSVGHQPAMRLKIGTGPNNNTLLYSFPIQLEA